jgi:DNA-binding response OmpR family regulator
MAHRILLVDDDEAILDVFTELLTGRGYLVDCARELKEVEVHLAQHIYSVSIADLGLTHGEDEGLQVIECLARQPSKPKVIVCSGNATSEVKEKVLSMGADMFLPKPFIFKTFLKGLEDLLQDASPATGVHLVNSKEITARHALSA